jgi:hypothetical protein
MASEEEMKISFITVLYLRSQGGGLANAGAW